MKKILFISGDYWHAAGPQCAALQSALAKTDIKAEWIQIIPTSRIPWKSLSEFDLIILAKEGFIPGTEKAEVWITPDQEQLFLSYVETGGCFFSFHNGTAGYPPRGTLNQMMRGRFIDHPPMFDFSIHTKGLHSSPLQDQTGESLDFPVYDEFYRVTTNPTQTNVFCESVSEKYGRQISGWTHPIGKGTVLAFTPGHTQEVMNGDEFQLILKGLLSFLLS